MTIHLFEGDIYEAGREYKMFLAGKAGGFTSGLFELIPHADRQNRYKLAQAFPAHVYVYQSHVGEDISYFRVHK
jgi:hypothetical protein